MEQEKLKRVAVIGLPGSGKSTFAIKLRKRYSQVEFLIFRCSQEADTYLERVIRKKNKHHANAT